MSCTILVPVYNEAMRIESVVGEIVQELDQLPHDSRILVLNDGSTDWTPDLEQRLRSRGPVRVESFYPNRGTGAMLDEAFDLFETPWAIVLDPDGEYQVGDVPRILDPLRCGNADWVMGSRYGHGRPRPTLIHRTINQCFRLLSGIRVEDLLTGMYGFRTDLVRGIHLREQRFAYTPELLWKVLARARVRVREIPIDYRVRAYAGKQGARLWEAGTILMALIRYRISAARTR